MNLHRRAAAAVVVGAAAALAAPLAVAQSKKDTVTLAMVLEPPRAGPDHAPRSWRSARSFTTTSSKA